MWRPAELLWWFPIQLLPGDSASGEDRWHWRRLLRPRCTYRPTLAPSRRECASYPDLARHRLRCRGDAIPRDPCGASDGGAPGDRAERHGGFGPASSRAGKTIIPLPRVREPNPDLPTFAAYVP